MADTGFASLDDGEASAATDRLLDGRRGSLFASFVVGTTVGCWISYVLVYPFSSLPLPKYTVGAVVVLGWHINHFARSMTDRMHILIAVSFIAYVTAFVAFALPAIAGWYSDPIVRRSVYLQGFRQVFIFTLPAVILLIVGTLGSYVIGETYAEVTR